MSLIPSVGKRVRFGNWQDPEWIGKFHYECGDGTNRPSTFAEWTGEVVEIIPRRHKKKSIFSRDMYIVKRDFDGFEQQCYAKDILEYV